MMRVMRWLTSPMAATLRPTASMASPVPCTACWMSWICALTSLVAWPVRRASSFTSAATTEKPRPASPARAASMVALSASSEVCPAMALISLITSSMRPAAAPSVRMVSSARASSAAVRSLAMRASSTCLPESTASVCTSIAADAMAATSSAACSAAFEDIATCCAISRLLSASSAAVPRMRSPALVKALTTSSMPRRKLPVKKVRPA